jgi:acyl-CoA synthetase (AMP-forming)/AMP-acid ligase II
MALVSAEARLTWQMLDELSSRLAGSLREHGLQPGDRVASLMPNRRQLVIHYPACFKAGRVATPLNYRYMAPEIDHALRVSKASALLADVERNEDLEASELASHLPLGRISYGAPDDPGASFEAFVSGYLYFCGRRKQIIVHDGSNITPQEIEGALLEHSSVESAGVIGVDDVVRGENVRAYITLREGAGRPTDQELIRFARAKVGYKAPEEIVVLDEMPRTATGKVDRTWLKRMAELAHEPRG